MIFSCARQYPILKLARPRALLKVRETIKLSNKLTKLEHVCPENSKYASSTMNKMLG